jgi:hypothetical protein
MGDGLSDVACLERIEPELIQAVQVGLGQGLSAQ